MGNGITIIKPDYDFFENNFNDDIDLWEWKNEVQKKQIRNTILIAYTFDG